MKAGLLICITHFSGRRDDFTARLKLGPACQFPSLCKQTGYLIYLNSLFFIQLKEEQGGCLQKVTHAVP